MRYAFIEMHSLTCPRGEYRKPLLTDDAPTSGSITAWREEGSGLAHVH